MKYLRLIFYIYLFVIFSSNSLNAQDWPKLNKFKEENAKLKEPATNENRVVFMGNSITEGWLKTYPEYFQGEFINRGISGQTTPQMLIRFRSDVIKLKPKVVVILAGTNDIAGNTGPSTLEMIMDNLISMTELAQANGIKVVLCSVLPAYDYSWRPGKEPNIKIPELNKMIKEYARETHVTYVDYFSAMVDNKNGMKEELTNDGVHPTALGYDVMQPIIEKAIKEALKK